jgi:hypothetical protein
MRNKLFAFCLALVAIVAVTASSFGTSMMLTGVGTAPGAPTPPTLSFIGATSFTVGANPQTITNVAIGAASANRRVIIVV